MKIKALLFAAAAMVGISAFADGLPESTKLYVDPVEMDPGQTVYVALNLNNLDAAGLSAFGVDLIFPEGLTPVQFKLSEAGYTGNKSKYAFMHPELDEDAADLALAAQYTASARRLRMTAYDAEAEGLMFEAGDRAIVLFAVQADEAAKAITPGDYSVTMNNMMVSSPATVGISGSLADSSFTITVKGEDTPTAVTDINAKAVAGVKYYNLAGVESDQPFDGVNVVVTTYTDGTKAASKVIK